MNIDIQKEENKNNKMFSKYSTVIKIIKNKNSNKAFISFGTFYKNKKSGNLHYKTFLQRQLVDYIHEDNDYSFASYLYVNLMLAGEKMDLLKKTIIKNYKEFE